MAINVKHKLNADFAIGVTGYAGPDGGTEQSPVGTAYVSIIDKSNKHYSYTINSSNKYRSAVITRTCNLILAEFLQLLYSY
jgi:nicotinamide-nucleotide amidase